MMKVGEGGIDGMHVGRDNVKLTTSNTEGGQYHIESPPYCNNQVYRERKTNKEEVRYDPLIYVAIVDTPTSLVENGDGHWL